MFVPISQYRGVPLLESCIFSPCISQWSILGPRKLFRISCMFRYWRVPHWSFYCTSKDCTCISATFSTFKFCVRISPLAVFSFCINVLILPREIYKIKTGLASIRINRFAELKTVEHGLSVHPYRTGSLSSFVIIIRFCSLS